MAVVILDKRASACKNRSGGRPHDDEPGMEEVLAVTSRKLDGSLRHRVVKSRWWWPLQLRRKGLGLNERYTGDAVEELRNFLDIDDCEEANVYCVFSVFSLKHAGVLLASGDIDPKLEYGPLGTTRGGVRNRNKEKREPLK
ncbi:hypothetical protein L484_021085 [Morus notabilis]|uniref:Uncharacterized protein n=1 Tax=Morus notabilis TaxID=981085 RepID=W9R9L8_9ROSA|nr:hypothetical protein L484_021085 [Morus notabilis]